MKTDILGVKFDDITLADAVERGVRLVSEHRAAFVVTPNPEIVMAAEKDAALLDALNAADMVLPDGIGIVYSARILGTPLSERVPGIDFASGLLARLAQKGGSVYLLARSLASRKRRLKISRCSFLALWSRGCMMAILTATRI